MSHALNSLLQGKLSKLVN